jgi:hypothetical protein
MSLMPQRHSPVENDGGLSSPAGPLVMDKEEGKERKDVRWREEII